MSRLEWRPTRLVAEDNERLVKLVVEEDQGRGGWLWTTRKGSRVRMGGSLGPKLIKDQAIEQAKRAAEQM